MARAFLRNSMNERKRFESWFCQELEWIKNKVKAIYRETVKSCEPLSIVNEDAFEEALEKVVWRRLFQKAWY